MRYLISSDAFVIYEMEASSEAEALALSRTWNREHPTLDIEGYPHVSVILSDHPEIEQTDDDLDAPPRLRLVERAKP